MTIDEVIAKKAKVIAERRAIQQVSKIADVLGFAELPAAKAINQHLDDLRQQIFEQEFESLKVDLATNLVDAAIRMDQGIEGHWSISK